jgi:hypothetical protein
MCAELSAMLARRSGRIDRNPVFQLGPPAFDDAGGDHEHRLTPLVNVADEQHRAPNVLNVLLLVGVS